VYAEVVVKEIRLGDLDWTTVLFAFADIEEKGAGTSVYSYFEQAFGLPMTSFQVAGRIKQGLDRLLQLGAISKVYIQDHPKSKSQRPKPKVSYTLTESGREMYERMFPNKDEIKMLTGGNKLGF
jgi:hypothetical protein